MELLFLPSLLFRLYYTLSKWRGEQFFPARFPRSVGPASVNGPNFTGEPRWHFSSEETSRDNKDGKKPSEEVMPTKKKMFPSKFFYQIFSTEDIHEISTEFIFLYQQGPCSKFKQRGTNIVFTEARHLDRVFYCNRPHMELPSGPWSYTLFDLMLDRVKVVLFDVTGEYPD